MLTLSHFSLPIYHVNRSVCVEKGKRRRRGRRKKGDVEEGKKEKDKERLSVCCNNNTNREIIVGSALFVGETILPTSNTLTF